MNHDIRELRVSAQPRLGSSDRPRRVVERLPAEDGDDASRSER